MNKNKHNLACILVMVALTVLSGCNKAKISTQSSSTLSPASTPSSSVQAETVLNQQTVSPDVDYSIYKGKWICGEDLNTSEMIMKNGGAIIDIQEINEGHIKGTFLSVQKSNVNRVASTDFQGTIFNNKLDFSFENDGFYNKGKCSIAFEKDRIIADVSTIVSEDNSSGWSLGNGSYIFAKETTLNPKGLEKDMNISEEEAINVINQLIEEKKIVLTEPNSNCEIQHFGSNIKDNVTYYVIRVAYIDPNNKENTETLARYWVSAKTKDVFQEDLWTGVLAKIK